MKMGTENNMENDNKPAWENMSYEEKNRELYFKQKRMLEEFFQHGAISKEQFEKSLHDLTEKMGMQ